MLACTWICTPVCQCVQTHITKWPTRHPPCPLAFSEKAVECVPPTWGAVGGIEGPGERVNPRGAGRAQHPLFRFLQPSLASASSSGCLRP